MSQREITTGFLEIKSAEELAVMAIGVEAVMQDHPAYEDFLKTPILDRFPASPKLGNDAGIVYLADPTDVNAAVDHFLFAMAAVTEVVILSRPTIIESLRNQNITLPQLADNYPNAAKSLKAVKQALKDNVLRSSVLSEANGLKLEDAFDLLTLDLTLRTLMGRLNKLQASSNN